MQKKGWAHGIVIQLLGIVGYKHARLEYYRFAKAKPFWRSCPVHYYCIAVFKCVLATASVEECVPTLPNVVILSSENPCHLFRKKSISHWETINHYMVIALGRTVNVAIVETEIVDGERQNVFYHPVSVPVEAENFVGVFPFFCLYGIRS